MFHRRKMRLKPDPDWSPMKNDFVTEISSRFRWRIENYSRFNSYPAQVYHSDEFEFGSYKWRLALYPKGKDNDNHISIFLESAGSLGFSSNTWYNSSFPTFGSSIGSCSDKIGSFTGTTTVSNSMRSSDSHGSPIGSSCRLASANFGSPFGFASASSSPSCSLASTSSNPSCSLASTGSSPSCSLASVNLGSSFSFISPYYRPSFRLSSRNDLQNMEYSLSVIDQIHNKYTVRKEGQHEINGQNRVGCTSFMPLSQLNDPDRGYLANDTFVIEAEIGFPGFLVNSSQKTVADKSTETEPQVLSFMQIMSDMDPVTMSVPEPETQTELGGQKNQHAGEEKAHFEHTGVEDQVTKTETLLKCEAPTSVHSNKVTPMLEYNLAGQLFEDGRHRQGTGFDEKFEDVGGFSVLKTQVPIYKQIWLKYGHIASSQVLMDSYSAQVSVVTDIMNSVLDMNKQRVSELSSEMIEAWEKKIKMSEKLEFNISWLRKRFDLVKEDFYGVQKLQTALVEHDQAKARLVAAEEQLMFANNEMKKARENLSVLEARLTPLLIQKKMYEEKSTRLVLDGLL